MRLGVWDIGYMEECSSLGNCVCGGLEVSSPACLGT